MEGSSSMINICDRLIGLLRLLLNFWDLALCLSIIDSIEVLFRITFSRPDLNKREKRALADPPSSYLRADLGTRLPF